MTKWEWCFPDTTGKMHIEAHSVCHITQETTQARAMETPSISGGGEHEISPLAGEQSVTEN